MVSRRFGVVVAVLLGSSVGGEAVGRADPQPTQTEVRAARQLFTDAERDEAAGRWGEALEKFAKVVAFKETPSGLFHKAFCEEKLGLLLVAYRDYRRAAQLNEMYAASSAENKKLIEKETAASMLAILPRIPSLRLRVPAGVAGVRVSIDEVELKPDELDVSRQVEPGRHIVEASAPGRLPFRRLLTLTEGANETITLTFAEPAPALSPPPTPKPAATLDGSAPSSTRQAAIWAGAGASVALAATSTVFFLKGRSVASELDRECARIDVLCQRDELESARDRNYLVAGVAGGLAAVGAGVTVWFALSDGSKAAPSRQAWAVSPHGVAFRGSF